MTQLERLIQQQVNTAVVTTIGRTIDRIAEDMAAELLKDAPFRADLLARIRQALTRTVDELNTEATQEEDGPG